MLKVCGEGTKRWSSSSGTLYKIFQELRKRSHVALYGSVTKNVGIVVLNFLRLSFGVLVFFFVSPHHSCKMSRSTQIYLRLLKLLCGSVWSTLPWSWPCQACVWGKLKTKVIFLIQFRVAGVVQLGRAEESVWFAHPWREGRPWGRGSRSPGSGQGAPGGDWGS